MHEPITKQDWKVTVGSDIAEAGAHEYSKVGAGDAIDALRGYCRLMARCVQQKSPCIGEKRRLNGFLWRGLLASRLQRVTSRDRDSNLLLARLRETLVSTSRRNSRA
jgi:hypothetical protein